MCYSISDKCTQIALISKIQNVTLVDARIHIGHITNMRTPALVHTHTHAYFCRVPTRSDANMRPNTTSASSVVMFLSLLHCP